MSVFFMLFSSVMMVVYHSYAIKFAKSILHGTTDSRWDCVLIALFNTVLYHAIYLLGGSYPLMLWVSGALFLLEFAIISKTDLRQLFFGASVFGFNIIAVSVVVFVSYCHLIGVPTLEVFENDNIFYISNFFSQLMLVVVLKMVKGIVPLDKLRGMSSTRQYSEVVTLTAACMSMYLIITAWVVMAEELYVFYLFSTIVSVSVMAIAFYCLFFFNVNLISLYSFKRKSDRADVMRRKNIEKQTVAEKRLYTDELTGTYNKLFIERKLDEFCQREGFSFAVIYSDLASLKHVNDNYGHAVGDEYIKGIADIFRNSVREDDYVARIGGDEFLVLLDSVEEAELHTVVSRIKRNITIVAETVEYRMHANLGFTVVGPDSPIRDKLQILEEADRYMREDKKEYYARGGGYV